MNNFLLASHLLSYPTQELIDDLEPTTPLTTWLKQENLFTIQEHYVEVFDRTPKNSLYLFEHIHADSRARGKALVDLKEMYKKETCFLQSTELPDYLPLFLEFLSLVSQDKALPLLKNINPILARLSLNLKKIPSLYSEVIDSLLITPTPTNIIAEKEDEPDIDKVWQEALVTFNMKGCNS